MLSNIVFFSAEQRGFWLVGSSNDADFRTGKPAFHLSLHEEGDEDSSRRHITECAEPTVSTQGTVLCWYSHPPPGLSLQPLPGS